MSSDPFTEVHPNLRVWNEVYANGQFLAYPYEVAVRLLKRRLADGPLEGTVIDHGCGSGNHLEMFVRNGVKVHGTEISLRALNTVRARFMGANLVVPPLSLIDPSACLAGQLPPCDHVFCWGAVHYNYKEKALADIAALVDALPSGGWFVLCVPSRNDVVTKEAVELPDGTLQVATDVSGQLGSVVTVPADAGCLAAWCAGIEVEDIGVFGWTIRGVRSEFHYLVGTRQ